MAAVSATDATVVMPAAHPAPHAPAAPPYRATPAAVPPVSSAGTTTAGDVVTGARRRAHRTDGDAPPADGAAALAPPVAPSRRPAPRPPAEIAAPATGPGRRFWLPPKTWRTLLIGLAALLMVGICGFSSWLIVLDERKGTEARPRPATVAAGPAEVPRDISSRTSDAAPLTEKEVFPSSRIVINKAEPAYRVLDTTGSKSCRTAAAGDIAKLLDRLGCSQVVRGTLRSPTGAYLVTAGIFNLEDKAGAEFARKKIRPIVDSGKGRFPGMPAGKGTEALALASAQVGWDIRGHYLIYCVIARANRKNIKAGDPFARQILFDIVEMHLRDGVLEKRAVVKVAPAGTP